MTDDATLGRTRWLDPDSATVTDALRAYHGTDEAWREPYRTKQGENDERFRMALALETAMPEPRQLTLREQLNRIIAERRAQEDV